MKRHAFGFFTGYYLTCQVFFNILRKKITPATPGLFSFYAFSLFMLFIPSVKVPAAGPMGRWAAGPASAAIEVTHPKHLLL